MNFPSWHLGRYPHHEFIITSHTASLAEKFSRRIRERLRDKKYGTLFPNTKLHKDSQSVQQWNTEKGGGLLAAGVGGAILGSGAHVLVIDDPIKNAEEAQSESVLEQIWEWFATTAYTRLAPGGGVLIIMQRWSGVDLAGMLQKKAAAGEGDEYEVVSYPAIAEEDEKYRRKGEALHEARYPLERLEAIKRTLDDWMWSALFQQKPTRDEGSYFSKEMVRLYDDDELPPDEELTFYSTWDFAISQKQRADWTVGISAGVDKNGQIWLVDRVRGRMDSFEIAEAMLQMWEDRPHDIMAGEQGQIKLALGPYLMKEAEDRGLYDFELQELSTGRRDKVQRARAAQGLMRRGKVLIPKNAAWRSELVEELMSFPNGEHDDQVDALAYLGLLIQDLRFIERRTRSPRKEDGGWRAKLRELMGQSRPKSFMGA
jgi:predicted phage terminase large subunit-like protein